MKIFIRDDLDLNKFSSGISPWNRVVWLFFKNSNEIL